MNGILRFKGFASFENLNFKLNNSELSNDNLKTLTNFLFNFLNAQARNKISLIYRGESYSNLKSKLRMEGNTPDYNKLNDFLFLIGEKGKLYRKEYRDRVKDKQKLFNIDDASIKFLRYIFKKNNKILNTNSKVIKEFKVQNPKFNYFFSERMNEEKFVEIIKDLSHEEKLKIRDYYLRPLHHLGVIGYFNNSIFLSTTTDIEVAKKFSGTEREPHSIIFVSWISNSKRFHSLSSESIKPLSLSVLPTYQRSYYPRQKEISMIGGILPHYIVGYIKVDTQELELNPNLFSTTKCFDEVMINGFDIDQTQFTKKIKETDYEIFYSVDEQGNYWNSV